MMAIQVGQSVGGPDMFGLPARAWLSPIKFEEKESWSLADTFVARAFVVNACRDENSSVPFRDVVKRLRERGRIEEEHIIESLPRLLRYPPDSPDGVIKGIILRRQLL